MKYFTPSSPLRQVAHLVGYCLLAASPATAKVTTATKVGGGGGGATAAGLPAAQRAAIYQQLQAPIQITLTNGSVILGHSIQVSSENTRVGTSKGAGEAIFTFKLHEIDQLKVPGEQYKLLAIDYYNKGQYVKALEISQLLYQQRVNMLPLLPAKESRFFLHYVKLVLQLNQPARALGITSKLRPQIQSPAALERIDDAILSSYYRLELYRQSDSLAQQWIDQHAPEHRNALGYYILGVSKLRTENYLLALELGLQPIVFAGPLPTQKLAECYAVAISAALGLRQADYAAILFDEMQERSLNWPLDNPTLAPFRQQLLQQLKPAKNPPL
jgi:hypothetical protein